MSIDPVLLQQIINGLSLGAMYALLALGFTLVYGILELINFAHFNVFMVSSFIGMWALELLGISGQSTVLGGLALVGTLVFAFVVTMLSAGVLGVAIERIALRPLRNARGTAAMITTIGDRKSTRLNSSHRCISYDVFCLKKKNRLVVLFFGQLSQAVIVSDFALEFLVRID